MPPTFIGSTRMPSTPLGPVLLALSADDHSFPWSNDEFRARTHLTVPPWDQVDPASPPHWDPQTRSNVKAFVTNFFARISNSTSVTPSYGPTSKADNDAAGRAAWDDLVAKNVEKNWGINSLVDKTLEASGITPWILLREFKTTEV